MRSAVFVFVVSGGVDCDWLLEEAGLYDAGAAHEVRRGQVRSLQHRQEVCVQGWAGVYLR